LRGAGGPEEGKVRTFGKSRRSDYLGKKDKESPKEKGARSSEVEESKNLVVVVMQK